MLSEKLNSYVSNIWTAAKEDQIFGDLLPELEEELSQLLGDEKTLMQLLYATLPISDVAGVPAETLLGYVRHALMLRENSPFCKDVPEDYFLHFVFYPRINTEDLTDCRGFFYDLLAKRVEGMGGREAALDINWWTCENMTYRSSNDRTESPLAAYRAGLGRCGEESTFAVTAYRSVGIPARQIYVPFWAHCDDNHAWVEVFVEGKWYFLGACEPEPILNRGWFTDASSRAPLECFRTFFDYEDEGMAKETLYEKSGICRLYNVVDRYAKYAKLIITVTDPSGAPVSGASVHVDVVNMAAYQSICNGITDEKGQYAISLGYICAHVEAFCDGAYAEAEIAVAEGNNECHLTLGRKGEKACGEKAVDYLAPGVAPINRTVLTPEQQEENTQMLSEAAAMRRARIDAYFLPEYENLPASWQEILHMAGGNAGELAAFAKAVLVQEGFADEKTASLEAAADMLRAMETKDYRDITCDILLSHWEASRIYADEPHFVEEIQNPRMHIEMIEDWRGPLADAFTEEEKASYVKNPQHFMDMIAVRYPQGNARYYPELSMQPTAVLKTGLADARGRKLMFVAGMRCFGVPARINPADGGAEYWRDGQYHRIEENKYDGVYEPAAGIERKAAKSPEKNAVITLCPQDEVRFVYSSNYTLARWDAVQGRYQTLNYAASGSETPAEAFSIQVLPGDYRLLTAGRLPNGAQHCLCSEFTLQPGQQVQLPLLLRGADPQEMLSCNQLDAFTLTQASGEEITSEHLADESSRLLLIYLEVSKEPTEHIINELVDAKDAVKAAISQGMKLACVLRKESDLEDPTLKKLLAAIPETVIYYDDFKATAIMLARKMFLEPGVWPLAVLADQNMQGRYGTCGYQVGTIELVMKLNKCF